MAVVIDEKILVSNAFFAKQKKELKYEEIEKFRKILTRTLTKDFKNVSFTTDDDICIDANGILFIKKSEGILRMNNIDAKDIKDINSSCKEDVKNLLALARDEFKEME